MKQSKSLLVFISVLSVLLLPFDSSYAEQSQKKPTSSTQTSKKTVKKSATSAAAKSKSTAVKSKSTKAVTAKKSNSAAKSASVKKSSAVKYATKKSGTHKYTARKSTGVKSRTHTASLHRSSEIAKTSFAGSKHQTASRTAHYTPRHSSPVKYAYDSNGKIYLNSAHVLVQDQTSGKVLYEKSAGEPAPIASITKLMTAMVALDAVPDLSETMTIAQEDVDMMRHSRSRLPVGTKLSREEMLRLALMSSENRAASALARYYPGGKRAFVEAMNSKALALGMFDTYFYDSTGLNAGNVSSARDLARMVAAAGEYPLIRQMTSTGTHDTYVGKRLQRFNNTNALVRNPDWNIEVSKTGYINEAGKCLVMKTWINAKPTIIVLLDAPGSSTRLADSMRIKSWLESPSYLTSGDAAVNALPPGDFE